MSVEMKSHDTAEKPRTGKLKELESITEKNKNDLNSYFHSICLQQKALITNNLAELEESVMNQEKILNSIDENQNLTAELMDNIIKENNLEIKTPGFKGFLESIKGIYKKEYENLSALRRTITDLVKNIVDTNNKNKILIDHSRNFIKEIMSALSNQDKPVLDRKI